jgi:hypothetical protein
MFSGSRELSVGVVMVSIGDFVSCTLLLNVCSFFSNEAARILIIFREHLESTDLILQIFVNNTHLVRHSFKPRGVHESRAGIFKHFIGIGSSYRPVRLHRLAELIHWNQILGSLKV